MQTVLKFRPLHMFINNNTSSKFKMDRRYFFKSVDRTMRHRQNGRRTDKNQYLQLSVKARDNIYLKSGRVSIVVTKWYL